MAQPLTLRDTIPGYDPMLPPTMDSLVPRATLRDGAMGTPMAAPDLIPMQDEAEAASMGQFGRAYRSSQIGHDVGTLAAQESAARAAGDVVTADQLRNQRLIQEQRQGAFAPAVGTLRDIDWDPSKAVDWFATQAGNGLGSSVNPMLVGAGLNAAGNVIGAIPTAPTRAIGAGLRLAAPAAMTGMFYQPSKGEAYKEMMDRPDIVQNYTPEQIDTRASLVGGAGAALESVVPALLARKVAGASLKAGTAAKSGVTMQAVRNSAEEGVTEVAQKALTDVAVGQMDPTRAAGSAENYLDAFASGAAGVAGQSAVAGAADVGFSRMSVKGDGKNGDAIPLDGKPMLDQMKDAGTALPENKAARRAVLMGEPPEDVGPETFEAWSAQAAPARQVALLEELAKIKDPRAAALAKRVAAVDTSSPDSIDDPAFAEATAQVIRRAGLMTPEELTAFASVKKNSLQVSPADLGSMKGPDTPEPNTKVGPGTAAWEQEAQADHDTRAKFNTSFLQSNSEAEPGRPVKDVVEMLGREIAAMTSTGVAGKATALELRRAEAAGRALATLTGNRVADVLDTLAQRNPGAEKSKAFQAMAKQATALVDGTTTHETEEVRRSDAAAELVALVPTDKATALLDAGVDLSKPNVASYLLNAIEALHQGDTKQRAELVKRFGQPVVDAMLERVDTGPAIEPRFVERSQTSGKTAAVDSDGDSADETTEFEQRQEEKSLDKIAPDASLFFHARGGKSHTVKDWVNAPAAEKLPTLVPKDAVLKKLSIKAIDHIQALATQAIGGKNHAINMISGTEMLNRGNVPQSKREDLMLRYMSQSNAEGTDKLIEKVSTMRTLARMDRQLSAVTDGKGSLAPGGGRRSVVEKAGQAELRIDHAQIAKLALPDDKALAGALADMTPQGRATHASAIVRRALDAMRKELGDELGSPDAYFKDKYLVVAEQNSNDDYLQMKQTDAQAMIDMGKRALAHADKVGSKKMGPAEAKAKAVLKAVADANLIWFKSPLATGAGGVVAIPANMLVKWVRDGRNAHTSSTKVEVDSTSKSETNQTIAYRNDLLEGITGFMESGHATEGTLPWIENYTGEREDFTKAHLNTVKPGASAGQKPMFPLNFQGSLPPSLDLGGMNQKQFTERQAFAAEKRRNEEARFNAANPDMATEIAAAEKQAKDKELAADDVDVQDREATDRAIAEAAGSKRDEAERESHERERMVLEAAADADVRPLRKGSSFAAAMKIAEGLWRTYAADRTAGLERIQSYLRSIDRPTSTFDDEGKRGELPGVHIADPNALLGGPQYVEPLAALLTPRHMAWIKKNDPDNLKTLLEIRSRVGTLLAAQANKKGGNNAKMGQMVHALSGYGDTHANDSFVRAQDRVEWLQKVGARDAAVKARELATLEKNREALIDAEKAPAAAPGTLETLPGAPKAPPAFQGKETAKMTGADLVLAPTTATVGYAGSLARWAEEAGRLFMPTRDADLTGKTVYASVPGAGRGWTAIESFILRAKAVIDRGGVLRTDNYANATRPHNVSGEGRLRAELVAAGYKETASKDFSSWSKSDTKKANDQVTDAQGLEPVVEVNAKLKMLVPGDPEILQARMWLRRIGMKEINVLIQDAFPDMKGAADYDTVKDIVRIATATPVSVLQRAYHEGVHRLFAVTLKNSPEARTLVEDLVNNPKMIERLAALYAASPAAVAAIRSNREEAVAYAFQLWAFDPSLLSLGKKPTTLFEKVQAFLRRALGVVRDSEKALAILESFHDGKLAEVSEAGKVIDKIMQSNSWREKIAARYDKQVQAAKTEVIAAINVTRDQTWSKTAKEFGEKFFTHSADADADTPGYINRKEQRLKQYSNQTMAALAGLRGDNQERDLRDLAKALNSQTDAVQPHVQEAATKVRTLLSRFYTYAKNSGLDIGERDPGKYFPRVMDLEYLVEHKQDFIDMLVAKYPAVLKAGIATKIEGVDQAQTIEDVATRLYQLYVDHGGVDDGKLAAMREDGVLNPFFASQNTRELHWIRAEDIQPFLSTDPVSTLSRYFSQGVRAVEYTRAFGPGGADLKDAMAREGDIRLTEADGTVEKYDADGPVLTELKAAAAKDGLKGTKADEWVNRRHEDFQRSFGAMEGSLGKDITYGWRQAQGAIMAYQTLRTLPLSLFSAMLDPNGIRVAGGTKENFYGAYIRGMKAVFNMWKDLAVGNMLGSRDPDKYENAAMAAGVLDSGLYLEGMGAVSTSEFTAGLARKINHKFFLANGITAWDRAMRTEAVKAAMQAIVSNEANTIPQHSKRWLRELGLTQGNGVIRTDAEGDLIVSRHALAALRAQEKGTTSKDELEQATADMEKIHFALNRWTNRAIMSPNAAIRPSRASDPHYSIFFQLKSFTYAFQESTLKFAMHEAENGNLDSGAQLLRGIPIMVAADVTKAMLTGGGSLPGYMANWTMADWLVHATNRAGLLGSAQFGSDMLGNPHGVLAGTVGVVGGPTVSQAVDAVFAPIGETAIRAVPGVNKVSGLAKGVGGLLDHATGGV